MADPSQHWGGAGGIAGGPTGSMVQKVAVTAGGMALAYQTGWLPALVRYAALGSTMMLGVIFTQQNSMLYQNNVPQLPKSPTDPRIPRGMRLSPELRGLPYQDLRAGELLSACKGESPVRLHGWLLLQPKPLREKAPTLIYSHGNAGNIAFRMDDVERQYHNLQANILIYDYRGYGDSEGSPSEEGLIADAEACLRYLRSREDIDSSRIVAFGRSLGGAVSLALARRNPEQLCALVLENTFLSVPLLAKQLFPMLLGTWPLSMVVGPLCTNKWESHEHIRTLPPSVALLLLSGLSDELVPADHMAKLHELSPAQFKRLVTFAKGSHNETPKAEPRRYEAEFRRFLDAACANAGGAVGGRSSSSM